MKTEKLSDEGIVRETAHITEIDMLILTLKKTNTEVVTDHAVYGDELRAKIASHKTQIKTLEFDLNNNYSYKLAMEKIVKNKIAIARHESNRAVHEKHISEGIPVAEDRTPVIDHPIN